MTHPKTLAVIRVFSSTDQKVLEKHAKIIEKLYGIPTRTYCIPNQPEGIANEEIACLLYTSPSPRDVEESRMPSSA